MRSKKRTIGILIVVIVLLLGVVSVILLINKHNNPRNEKENISSNIYNEKVDSAIDSVLFSEDYNTLSLDEKKNRMLSILYQLEKDGDILKDSIFYQENVKTIWFQYPDGFEDGVILEEYTKGFSGSADISNYVIAWDSNGMPSIPDSEIDISNLTKPFPSLNSTNSKINFHEPSYPFLEEEVKNLELSAKYMFGWCDANDTSNECYRYLVDYQENKKIWNNNYLKTDIDDTCTVEDFKTGLLEYDIVFIEEHGTLLNNIPIICTREEYDKTKYKDDKKHLLFPKDNNGKRHYLIKPSFFEKYYGNGKLKDTIVWISSCHGYQYNDLAYAFEKCGASAVVGYNESILLEYDKCLQNAFVYDLMYGGTVSEALEFSKKIWTPNDKEFTSQYSQYFGNCGIGTEAKVNTNGKNARLINLAYYSNVSGTVKDENGNPIKGAEIGIHNVRGMSHGITATTNENGEYTLECPQDSYKIVVKADGYEVFETDDFVNVVYGEETIFNITLKKVIEPTDHIEPTLNYSAIDLIDKTLPEIISLMNGEYQIIKTENDGYIYIQNQSVLSGMEFYIQVSGDDIISANNGEEIHNDTLKAKLESGELTLDGIQVNKSGKVSETIQADMDYKSCSKVLGDFNCIGGTGGYLGGDVSSLSYYYNDKNAKVILNFNIPEEIYKDLILGKISSVSSEEMKSYNPNLRNVVIRKVETVTTMQTEAKENLIELVPSGKISCYGEHRGAITNNGDLYLWGNNSDGQLGTVTDEFIKVYWDKNGISSTPIKVMENVACASLGYDTSAVITNDGSLYTWGCGRYGRLGNGDDDNSIEPIKIMDNAVSVSLGFEAGAVITNDSSLFVWGYNLYGLGNGDSGPFKSPVKIMDNVKKVKLGGDNGAVITNDDVLYIWGSNIWGQLGNGETTDNMKSPVQVMDKVKDISFGDYYCAILSNSGDIYICGRIVTNKGVIGTASVPTKLEISQQAKEISCCGNTIYFIGEDDCLYEMVKHNSPVKIMENVNCISSNVAITNDGCMYTWGSNECGQLGNGTTEDSEEPIKVMDNVMLS